MYSQSRRELTTDELSVLKARLRLTADDVVWLLFPFLGLGLAGLFLGMVIEWIARKAGTDVGRWPSVVGVGVLSAIGGALTAFLIFHLVGSRRMSRREIRSKVIDEIRVRSARVVRIGDEADEEPILVYDVGAGKVLFLLGSWMNDPTLFHPPDSVDSFPSDAFTISRLPESGTVLGVQVDGRPLSSVRRSSLKELGLDRKPFREFAPCVLMDGSLTFPDEAT